MQTNYLYAGIQGIKRIFPEEIRHAFLRIIFLTGDLSNANCYNAVLLSYFYGFILPQYRFAFLFVLFYLNYLFHFNVSNLVIILYFLFAVLIAAFAITKHVF